MDFTVTLSENLVERIEPLLAPGQTIEKWIANAAFVNSVAQPMARAMMESGAAAMLKDLQIPTTSPNAGRTAGLAPDTPHTASGP